MDATAAETTHPLDPLDASELERAVALLRREGLARERTRLISVDLAEPEKRALAAWRSGGPPPPRCAQAVLLHNDTGAADECLLDLDGDRVSEQRRLDGMQPGVSMDEYFEAGAACRADPVFREALGRRGITGEDVDMVHIEPWTVGAFEEPGRRVARCLS